MAKSKKRASFVLESFETRQLLSASTTDTSTTTTTPAAPVAPNIVGTIYLDRNADGTRGKSERGLRGFTVDLVDSTGATVDSVHSDRRGRFRFGGLTDGSVYTVKVESKGGFTATTDTSVTVTVAAASIQRVAVGENRVAAATVGTTTGTTTESTTGSTTDTGTSTGTGDGPTTTPTTPTTPSAPVKPSIVGVVYLDRNADAMFGRSERGLPGFTVTLTDSSGKTVASTTSDRIGRYRFASIADGTYTVTVSALDGFTASGAQTATVTVASGTLARSAFGETRDATSTGTPTDTGTGTSTTTDPAAPTAPPTGGRRGHRGPPPSDATATAAATGSASGTGSTGGSPGADCPTPPADGDTNAGGTTDTSTGNTDTTGSTSTTPSL